jgi:hypothetical protein
VTLADLWLDLERRLPSDRSGRMLQRIHPESPVDLHVSVSATGARRSLELEVAAGAADGIELPSPTRGIGMASDPQIGDGHAVLALELIDASAADLFTSVCADVAAVTAGADDDEAAVTLWMGRFARWRRFLERGTGGLSARRQRGLYAELWTIRELLAPVLGYPEAVDSWKGPDGAPRDFETSGVAVEVKSSAANEPQVVPIHGERQLDDTGLDGLYIVHLSLEPLRDAGETLPRIVDSLRTLTAVGATSGTLEDRLLASGYADMHEANYRHTGYALRRTSLLRVVEGFPRITERDLPDGVGSVRYALAIDACRDFEVPLGTLATALGA